MGTLLRFDMNKIINDHDLNIFVETGTFEGEGLESASKFNFDYLYSVELLTEYFNICRNNTLFKNDRHKLYHGSSEDKLPEILFDINKNKDNKILFWLDAHLPSMYGEGEFNDELEVPLKSELQVIRENRNVQADYFIIDDLRMYEDGSFGYGNWEGRKEFSNTDGISFIHEMFCATHKVIKNYSDEGYIVLIPYEKMDTMQFTK